MVLNRDTEHGQLVRPMSIWFYVLVYLELLYRRPQYAPSRSALTFGCHIVVEYWLRMRSSIVIDTKVEQSNNCVAAAVFLQDLDVHRHWSFSRLPLIPG
jgi:hypothetical protein